MSALTSTNVLRPGPGGVKALLARQAMALIPFGMGLLRRFRPILALSNTYVVTLHDDVLEVFGNDAAFGVVYNDNLQVLTGGEPFFLGMSDSPDYRAQLQAMRRVVMASDLPALGDKAEALAEALVAASGGRVEVVSLVRKVTFGVMALYFGVPAPEQGRLDVWATRLFEFQFAGSPDDKELRADVDEIGPAFRAHIDREIARRKAAPDETDDVLGRCLKLQAAGEPGYSDVEIRTALLCMVVGGPPQPPIVMPQAMEQLVRRPDALADAHEAAVAGNDARLHDIVIEAMRFDPLAPGLRRICAHRLDDRARNQTRAHRPEGRNRAGRVCLGDDGRAPGLRTAPLQARPPALRVHPFRLWLARVLRPLHQPSDPAPHAETTAAPAQSEARVRAGRTAAKEWDFRRPALHLPRLRGRLARNRPT